MKGTQDMPISRLGHYSVRTAQLESSVEFYTRVLGLREGFRPPFNFPGAWLYNGDDESDFGVVHLIGVDERDPSGLHKYLGDKALGTGTGTLDHLAFIATGVSDFREGLSREGVPFRERTVPGLGLHQVFFEDPSGVTIEMNFPAHEVA